MSQVGDDLLLLWLVLSRKPHSILSNDDPYNEMAIFNLKRIVTILEGIQQVIHDGKDQGLTERCECNIAELILDLKSRLAMLDEL